MRNELIRVFMDTDMRKQHRGLMLIAHENKVKLNEMKAGEHIIFVNSNCNRVKMYSYNRVLSYIYKDKGRIDLDTIAEIPRAFGDGGVDMDAAMKTTLIKKLEKKAKAKK